MIAVAGTEVGHIDVKKKKTLSDTGRSKRGDFPFHLSGAMIGDGDRKVLGFARTYDMGRLCYF